MPTPKIKVALLFILLSIISCITISFMTIAIYDQNSFLNIIEEKIIKLSKKIFSENKKEIINNTEKNEKSRYIININRKISPEYFLNLLYYLKDASVDNIIIDANFDNLNDISEINEIKNFINNEEKFFGTLMIDNAKGIDITKKNRYSNTTLKNFLYIQKTTFNHSLSNYYRNPTISNTFSIKPEKLGFITQKNLFFDNNNIDLICKFDNKYLFSIPFLIYTKNKNWDIAKINYNLTSISYNDNKIYYDQKSRATYRHNFKTKETPETYNFKEWYTAFENKTSIINDMKKINLFTTEAEGYQLYIEGKNLINSLYTLPEMKDEAKNLILTTAKNNVAKWKGFKNTDQEKIKNSNIYITGSNNIDWIIETVHQEKIINHGENLKRIPISIIIFISILITFILFFISLLTKKYNTPIIVYVIFILNTFLIYFILKISLDIDTPFISLFFTLTIALITGSIIKNFDSLLWINEVKSIFKGSIAKNYAKEIAECWKNNEWNLEPTEHLCTFLQVDTSVFLKKDIIEDDVEIIGEKNSEIELIIKNNKGIRNNFSPSQILCYFGNPPVYTDHAQKAIKTSFEICKSPIKIGSEEIRLNTAVHSKKEWFKYLKNENQKCYTYFGNIINILSAMTIYAKKFNISIIISDTVYKLCNFKLPVRMLDKIRISNITGEIRLFELLSKTDYIENQKFYDYFHAGLKLFEKQLWNEASAYFRQCLKINENDTPSQIYLSRCKEFAYVQPKENWDGIYEIDKLI